MFHALTNQNKQQNVPVRNNLTDEMGVRLSLLDVRQQRVAGLHSIYGNQAILRALSRSMPAFETNLASSRVDNADFQQARFLAQPIVRLPAPRGVYRQTASAAPQPENCPPPADMTCPADMTSPTDVVATLRFGYNSVALSAVQEEEILEVARQWRAIGRVTVRVSGYASAEGACDYNWRLACRRAQVVANLLENPDPRDGSPGVPRASLRIFSHGESNDFGPLLEQNRVATISFPRVPSRRIIVRDPVEQCLIGCGMVLEDCLQHSSGLTQQGDCWNTNRSCRSGCSPSGNRSRRIPPRSSGGETP